MTRPRAGTRQRRESRRAIANGWGWLRCLLVGDRRTAGHGTLTGGQEEVA